MAGLGRDGEVDSPECLGGYFSRIILGKIRFPGNGIRLRRPLVKGSLYFLEFLVICFSYILYH